MYPYDASNCGICANECVGVLLNESLFHLPDG